MKKINLLLFISCIHISCAAHSPLQKPEAVSSLKVLGVIAHPDDETSFSTTWFSISKLLGGSSDLIVITNGEGGYKYSTLGELVYKTELTEEVEGRSKLPSIRKKELRDAGDIIGIRNIIHLGEKDHRYTKDEKEVFSGIWDISEIKRNIKKIVLENDYDAIFVLMPTLETHGHHKATAIITLEAIEELPQSKQPIVLSSSTKNKKTDAEKRSPTLGLPNYPLTKSTSKLPLFTFDRTRSFGYKNRLNFKAISAWHIAAHKSQGTVQLYIDKGEEEQFWALGQPSAKALERAKLLFQNIDNGIERFINDAGHGY